MKWPFVSRARYDNAVGLNTQAHASIRHQDGEIATLLGRTFDLQETIATLTQEKADLQGALHRERQECDVLRVQVANLTEALTPAARKRSKLTQAIRDNARMPDGTIDRRLVNHFRSQANALLNQGMKEPQVIESLSQWQTTERADQITADRMVAMAGDEPG